MTVLEGQSLWVCRLFFNFDDPALATKEVRQAFAYLINNEETALALFEGYSENDGLVLNHNILGLPSYEEMLQYDYEYNVEKAKQLRAMKAAIDREKKRLESLVTYELIAEKNPEFRAMLEQFKAMGGEF